ncbi:helix-turn-helix domain-containing protein [Occallatibacter riparius]|uniref:Histidine kinase n=1 Tax=Occallatibacter riparius TaxID=1002689 RepID=A0A9J7BQ09_9BACT|nr:helix-turn-helix domain-containing protein [Occallatibacter riparius]UWZ84625.1 histidine kinase [Occallatibacter riparius]
MSVDLLIYNPSQSFEQMMADCRRVILRAALVDARGNQCKAAERLGMHRNTLARHCEALGINAATCKPKPPRGYRPSELARLVLRNASGGAA